jgi:hypothetical protein
MRIWADFQSKKMDTGTVRIYILDPDGAAIGTPAVIGRPQPQAGDTLRAFLEQIVSQLHIQPGPPVVKPHPQSLPPRADPSSMVFYLVARGSNTGSWREFPAENWIVLDHTESNALLPPLGAKLNTSWEAPPEVANKLLSWFYPQTEDTSRSNRSRILREVLRMTVVTLEGGMARARIEGSLRMVHSFYPGRDSGEAVEAKLLGFMDFSPGERRIQRLRLVTEKATYNDEWFDAALRSVSRETLEAQGQ